MKEKKMVNIELRKKIRVIKGYTFTEIPRAKSY